MCVSKMFLCVDIREEGVDALQLEHKVIKSVRLLADMLLKVW